MKLLKFGVILGRGTILRRRNLTASNGQLFAMLFLEYAEIEGQMRNSPPSEYLLVNDSRRYQSLLNLLSRTLCRRIGR